MGLYFTSWNECSSFILTLDKSVWIVSDYSSDFNIKRSQIDIDKVMCSNHSHLDTGCDVPGVTKGISTTTVLPDTDRENHTFKNPGWFLHRTGTVDFVHVILERDIIMTSEDSNQKPF